MEFTTVELTRPGGLLGAVYRRLLAPAFPPAELVDAAALEAALAGGHGSLLALLDPEGVPVAAAFGRWSADSRVVLLWYLAVDPGIRGHGLGGRVLQEAVGAWRGRYDPCLVLAEVEDPGGPAHPVHGDPRRRLAFYERAGARVLDLPYFQPGIGGPARRVPGMLLLLLHAAPEFAVDGGVAGAPLGSCGST
jgi:GNAT superfamily N-acetyltransferase